MACKNPLKFLIHAINSSLFEEHAAALLRLQTYGLNMNTIRRQTLSEHRVWQVLRP